MALKFCTLKNSNKNKAAQESKALGGEPHSSQTTRIYAFFLIYLLNKNKKRKEKRNKKTKKARDWWSDGTGFRRMRERERERERESMRGQIWASSFDTKPFTGLIWSFSFFMLFGLFLSLSEDQGLLFLFMLQLSV